MVIITTFLGFVIGLIFGFHFLIEALYHEGMITKETYYYLSDITNIFKIL